MDRADGKGRDAADGVPGVPLQLTSGAMRALGYAVVDAVVDRLAALRESPVATAADRAATEARLREPAPERGADPDAVLARVLRDVLADGFRLDHPRFFSYVPGPSNFVGAMADALAAGFNVYAGAWPASPGAAQLELVVVDWLRGWCGLPEGAGGLFLSGASVANLAGLAVARHARFGADAGAARAGVVYCSDQAHSSVGRALRLLGVGADRMRRLPADADFRLAPAAVTRAVAADRAAGLVPFCVVATAGTTNTGAVDPLAALADLCAAEGLWLHADGAFGAAAALCPAGRAALDGLGRVDSLALDAHKWLHQPIECGCLLVRDPRVLGATFAEHPEYLRDLGPADGPVHFHDLGPQTTRGFRALKLWMSVQVFGAAALRDAVARGIALAELAEQELHADPRWEVVTPAQLGIVTFRYCVDGRDEADGDVLNAAIAAACLAGGFAALSTTELRGRTVLRLCTINARTTEADIQETVRRLAGYGEALAAVS